VSDELFASINGFLAGNKEEERILSEDEVETLILSLASARGIEGFEEEEAFKLVKWAENIRIGEALLDLTLKGLTTADWDKEVDEPRFKATDLGREITQKENTRGLN